MGQWIDSDGDPWDRMCSYCTHHHNSSGAQLDDCTRQSKQDFLRYVSMSGDNGCPYFHTSDRIG